MITKITFKTVIEILKCIKTQIGDLFSPFNLEHSKTK